MKSILAAAAAATLFAAAPAQAATIMPQLFAVHLCKAVTNGASFDNAIDYAVDNSFIRDGEPLLAASGKDMNIKIAIDVAMTLCPDAMKSAYAIKKLQQPTTPTVTVPDSYN